MTSGIRKGLRPGLGIFGGTFDPIHHGHLIAAQSLLEELQLSRILFLVSAQPPHKNPEGLSSWTDRRRMAALATEDNDCFEVSELERERSGPSYTFETIEVVRSQYGREYHLHFIVGADSILEIFTWRHPERLLDSGMLVVIPRPGFDLSRLDRSVKDRVTIVPTPLVEIASSNIRSRVREGRPIRYLVPPAVDTYIQQNGLYRPSGGSG
jgi:nicotinate-nucleotide adenylyltransferase